ncbi:MAG: TetR/AcrR family transcriptional regulator [Oscillospiraceae bacterium]|nr:TetR/AcrR family transcriptional regulator [Oscillospiraceae bacterium]
MNFLKASDDKQEKIINISLKLFAINGYKHTTTDAITREANISKGILFHYFKTKKNLYFFLYDYIVEFIASEIGKQDFSKTADLFEYILLGAECKLNIMNKYPYIYEFFFSALKEDDKEIKEYISSKYINEIASTWTELLAQIDKNKFKNPDDIEKIANLLNYCSNGLLKEVIDSDFINIEAASNKFLDIVHMLKQNFYKEEYL